MAGKRKSVEKSVPPQLVPFAPGPDPRRGKGPKKGAPNAGRPPSAVVLACQELNTRLNLAEIVGQIAANPVAKHADRINAVKLVWSYGEGLPVQAVEIADQRSHEEALKALE